MADHDARPPAAPRVLTVVRVEAIRAYAQRELDAGSIAHRNYDDMALCDSHEELRRQVAALSEPVPSGQEIDELLRDFQIACEDAHANGRSEESIMPTAKHRALLRNEIRWRLLRVAALSEERNAARQTVGFFAAVIKSGEDFTPRCQEALDKAMGRAARQESPR